jgi:hypothetical protein
MTPHIPEEISIRSVDRSLFVLAGNMEPPRDPEEEDEEDEEDDKDDRADEPPVVREPDED